MEQKHLELRSLSPALSNLWLLPVLFKYIVKEYKINVAYIPVGLVSNSSKKSSQMTCASCMSNLSPFLSATKPLSIYLDSVRKKLGSVGAGCSPETKNINGSLIDNFNFLSVWFSRGWK